MINSPKAIIHLNRLIGNYELIQKKFPNKKILSVVKANAYGHGSVECALKLEDFGCESFAVFTINEGIELRNAGIRSEILVFSRMDIDRFDEAIKYKLVLNICDELDIDAIKRYVDKKGFSPKFHLKVDTGMTRLGVSMDNIDTVLRSLKNLPQIQCEGIYSHFSTADEGDLTYAHHQQERFNSVLRLADEIGISFKNIHCSNSGGILNLDQDKMSHIRVGMLLYGAFPSNEVPKKLDILPVMEFRASVVQIRNVKSGTKVSYGGVYETKADTHIGVIQCGFADGFPRPWYDGGYVSYEGRKLNIAGRICMDQFMVDFEELSPNIGDEVLLFGKNDGDMIKMESIADHIKSTPYVLATSIQGRTKRIYKD